MELIQTIDASHTLKVPGKEEHYHSVHGALAESMHVFIEAGWKYKLPAHSDTIRILEVGMGTGLNVLLTALASHLSDRKIHYTALEPFPLPHEITAQLNYPNLVAGENATDIFQSIHASPTQKDIAITSSFTLHKSDTPLQAFEAASHFDLIYFDAFAPRVQPELWTISVFSQLYAMANTQCVLVTYCSKGDVRRAMIAAGWQVAKIPGPPRKREMLRAVKL